MPHKMNVTVTRIHPMITKLQHINHSSVLFKKRLTQRKRELLKIESFGKGY